jgi:HEXXH motif-containing protein
MDFSLFSDPLEGDFLGLAEHLACSAGRSLVAKTLVDTCGLDEAAGARAIEAVTPERVSTAPWTPALGAVRMALARAPSPDVWPFIAGQLQTALFLVGALDVVDVAFAGVRPLAVAGETMAAGRWVIRGEGKSLAVDGDSGRVRRTFVRQGTDGEAVVWAADPARVIRFGDMAAAVFSDADWMEHWLPDTVRGRIAPDRALRSALIGRAADLLLERSPAYYLWIAAVLREVAPLVPDSAGTQSQSFPLWPGHIQVSQATLIGMLIALVHECSHQYFHMALWNGPIADTDAPLLPSVLARRVRPIEKVLLGFHAFGNVLLALRPIRAALNGDEVAEFDEQWRCTLDIVAGLDQCLSPAWERWLNANGRALYLPLRQRLKAEGLLPA